jgi:hypothetical protein
MQSSNAYVRVPLDTNLPPPQCMDRSRAVDRSLAEGANTSNPYGHCIASSEDYAMCCWGFLLGRNIWSVGNLPSTLKGNVVVSTHRNLFTQWCSCISEGIVMLDPRETGSFTNNTLGSTVRMRTEFDTGKTRIKTITATSQTSLACV